MNNTGTKGAVYEPFTAQQLLAVLVITLGLLFLVIDKFDPLARVFSFFIVLTLFVHQTTTASDHANGEERQTECLYLVNYVKRARRTRSINS